MIKKKINKYTNIYSRSTKINYEQPLQKFISEKGDAELRWWSEYSCCKMEEYNE